MKITKPTQLILKNAVDIATVLGVENMVLDAISLRGGNQELGVAIIMPMKDRELEFDSMGLSRINLLKARMQMLEDADVTFETFQKEADLVIVASLKFAMGRTKLSFKCADPRLIQAPKAINDQITYEMQLSDGDVQTIIKGIATMTSDVVNFSNDDEKIFIKISDTEGDTFAHELEGGITILDDTASILCKSYKAKTLRTIFTNYIKKDDNNILPISITRRGVMKILVLNMSIYVFPER